MTEQIRGLERWEGETKEFNRRAGKLKQQASPGIIDSLENWYAEWQKNRSPRAQREYQLWRLRLAPEVERQSRVPSRVGRGVRDPPDRREHREDLLGCPRSQGVQCQARIQLEDETRVLPFRGWDCPSRR